MTIVSCTMCVPRVNGGEHLCSWQWPTTRLKKFSLNWEDIHQGCPAATLLHAFGTHQLLKKVQAAMNRPGEFLASYSDNTSGRGSHRNFVASLSTMQNIGPAYGKSWAQQRCYLVPAKDGKPVLTEGSIVKAEDIITHPDEIPPPIFRLGRESASAELDCLRAQRAARYIRFPVARFPPWSPRVHLEISQRQVLGYVRSAEGGHQVQGHPVSLAYVQHVLIPHVQAINHMCRQIPIVYIMERASIFDDTLIAQGHQKNSVHEVLRPGVEQTQVTFGYGRRWYY
jgi:hypothetical protein